MKKYLVYGINREYLLAEVIEAKSAEEAKDLYAEKWEGGNVGVNDNEVKYYAEKWNK